MFNKLSEFIRKAVKFRQKNSYISNDVIHRIEEKLNYEFKNKDLVAKALKHRSFLSVTNESRLMSNERLELLGDAVLGMIVIEHLFLRFPSKEEGELTAIKSLIVSRKILANIAREIGLGEFILLNDAEEKAGGRSRPSILSDAFEAITGAIYLDGGLSTAVNFIREKLLYQIDVITSIDKYKNFKSILLEYSQSKYWGIPRYIVKKEEGPDHNKLFTIEVIVNNEALGLGKGNSKKKAEQIAAKNALKKIKMHKLNDGG
ncbi:ribonuclease III [candidate division KSB1 bacterium 4572_119]|nr:MAG: ribonuclease III [candidate division KSB1 bacterium 4572_119]